MYIYIYIYIYICIFISIYICSLVYIQRCKPLYMHIYRAYMHILGFENIYIWYIYKYIFTVFIWLFACVRNAAYMEMCAN